MDADQDGKISKDEVLKQFAVLDKNNDGAISKDELAAHARKAFQSPSGTGTGTGTGGRGRGAASKPAGPPRPSGGGFGMGGFGKGGFGGGAAFGPPSVDWLLERFDKNKDGALSKDEAPEPFWTRFSGNDADKNGSLSKAELETHFKEMRSRIGGGGPPFGRSAKGDDPKSDLPKSDLPKSDPPKSDLPKSDAKPEETIKGQPKNKEPKKI